MTETVEELQRKLDNEREQNRKLQNLIVQYAKQIQELTQSQCQCPTEAVGPRVVSTKYGHPLPYVQGQSNV